MFNSVNRLIYHAHRRIHGHAHGGIKRLVYLPNWARRLDLSLEHIICSTALLKQRRIYIYISFDATTLFSSNTEADNLVDEGNTAATMYK